MARYPLEGLRILDFSRYQQGPFATMLLADLGAHVIKVEPPGGEVGRRMGGRLDGGFAPYFQSYNRNKRSLTLDLTKAEAIAIVYRLVKQTDIVVENFRPGVMDELGLGFDRLREIKPDIILASASGFGPRGEWAGRGAFDIIAQAVSGMMMLQGGGPGHVPAVLFAGLGDQIGALALAVGCLSAVVARDKYGEAQRVDVSLLGSLLAAQGHHLTRYLATGIQEDTSRRASPTFGIYEAADGKWLAIAVIDPRGWPRLCRAIGRPELTENPRYRNSWVRMDNRDELEATLEETFRTLPRDTWVARLIEADVPVAPVYDYADLAQDPQAAENGYLVTCRDTEFGDVQMIGCPIFFQGMTTGPRTLAPELGQHTEEILLELGYDWEQIAELRAVGVTEPFDARQSV